MGKRPGRTSSGVPGRLRKKAEFSQKNHVHTSRPGGSGSGCSTRASPVLRRETGLLSSQRDSPLSFGGSATGIKSGRRVFFRLFQGTQSLNDFPLAGGKEEGEFTGA